MPIFKIKIIIFENSGWACAHPAHPLDPRLNRISRKRYILHIKSYFEHKRILGYFSYIEIYSTKYLLLVFIM